MRLRFLLPIVGLVMVAVLAYACSTTGGRTSGGVADSARSGAIRVAGVPTSQHPAMLRFVNAMPGSPALELGHDSTMLFSNVVFGAVAPYKPVTPKAFHFTLRNSSTVGFSASSAATLLANERYLVLALPDSGGRITAKVLRDDLVPDTGMARVRLIHATPGLGNLVFAIVGQDAPLYDSARDSGTVHFRDVSPMTASFRVRGGTSGRTLVSLRSMALTAGSTYTIVLTALPKGPLTSISFADAAGAGAANTVARR